MTHPPLTTICSCLGTCVQPLGEVPASEFASHILNEQILLSDALIPAAKGRLNVCDVRTRWEHRKLRLGDDSQFVNEAATSCWLSLDGSVVWNQVGTLGWPLGHVDSPRLRTRAWLALKTSHGLPPPMGL